MKSFLKVNLLTILFSFSLYFVAATLDDSMARSYVYGLGLIILLAAEANWAIQGQKDIRAKHASELRAQKQRQRDELAAAQLMTWLEEGDPDKG